MEKVNGIGGLFFRAKDPAVLSAWYAQHLGIDPVPTGPDSQVWQPSAGITIFAPFDADTTYFGNPDKSFMMNFRVGNLDRMIAQLRDAGIEVRTGPDSDQPQGRFAWLEDPEGNPIELWEPAQAPG